MSAAAAWPALLVLLGAAVPRAHPFDGPDLDLRIRIEAQRVLVQASFNLAFLDEVMPMARTDPYTLAEGEQAAVRERMFAWLRLQSTLRVDGAEVAPALAGFAVDPGDPRWLPLFPIFGAKALVRVQFDLAFPVAAPPRTVNVVWRAYPPDLTRATPQSPAFHEVRALLVAGGGEQAVVLRHDEPEFTWHAPEDGTAVRLLPVPRPPQPPRVALPLASLAAGAGGLAACIWFALRARRRAALVSAAAGAALGFALAPWLRVDVRLPFSPPVALPTREEAAAIFAPLHENLYRAFDCLDPDEVYDVLARSVDGTLLDTVYQDIYRSLVMAEQGGAVSRVEAVRRLATEVEDVGVLADGRTPCFTVEARWQVDGAVFHWGHRHWRTNEHRARYTVTGGPAGWRIAGAEPLAAETIAAGTGARPGAGAEGR